MHSRDHVSSDRAVDEHVVWLAPVDQPGTVHELAERLLPAYTVEGGTVHLAGCLLEDRLFLRAGARHGDRTVEVFLDGQGMEVDAATIVKLGMGQTVVLQRPAEHAEAAIRRLSALAGQMVIERLGATDSPPPVDVAAVWCKYAEGKLRFTIGENATDLPFADWARVLEAPPFVCPHSNHPTYHLVATDDGRIAAAEQVARCATSGQRVLAHELVTCSATGQRVLPEHTKPCPVTGETVLHTEMVSCDTCRQDVAPAAAPKGVCEACGRLEPVAKADPRLARVLGEHPVLDRWRHWRLSESATSYHLTARGWFRRILLIVDKDSLELTLLAKGHRFRSGWDVVDRERYDYVLRG